MRRSLHAISFVIALWAVPAFAQVEGDFSLGGGIRIGDSTTTCDAAAEGAILYDTSTTKVLQFCNGTAWQNVGGGGTPAGSDREIQFNSGGQFFTSSGFVITSAGNVGIGTASPQSALQVSGGIAIGNDADTCIAGKNGTIRYLSGGNPPWEYCDGSAWTALTSGGGALSDLSDVTLTSPVNSQVLVFDSSTSQWINQSPGPGLFTCPGGFTKLQSQGQTLGCMKSAVQAASGTNCRDAATACWTTYGGRLPTYNEYKAAQSSIGGFTIHANNEWLDEASWDDTDNESCGVIQATNGGRPSSYPYTQTAQAYRCYIPAGSNSTVAISGSSTLDDLTDVTIASPSTNQVLTYNGSAWINQAAGGGGATTIDELTDAFTDYTTNHNLIVGRPGAAALTSGARNNTFIGEEAGATTANATGGSDDNTAIGYQALKNTTSGNLNTAVGSQALYTNANGTNNVAVGASALFGNSSGTANVAVGSGALTANGAVSGTALGYQALYSNISGNFNTAVGAGALYSNVAKARNTALGRHAMYYADNTATGSNANNTAVGYQALYGSTTASANTGIDNTALGATALLAATSGGQNIAIGSTAGDSITSGSKNIVIGFGADTSAAGASNELNIGNTLYGTGILDGAARRIGVLDASPDHTLDVAGNIGLDASGYINFGDTDGTTGYGIRDNAGTIECKNSAGSWAPCAGGTPAGADRQIQFNSGGAFGSINTFKLMADGDLLLTGTYTGTASVPASGAGTRMFFDVQSAAFRAGGVNGTQWNSPGLYSAALGYNAVAGNYAVAAGQSASAAGDNAVALGNSASAAGSGGVAIGANASANAVSLPSVAIGPNGAVATAQYSVALGTNLDTAGDNSLVAGRDVTIPASGDGSFGFGLTSTSVATNPQVSGAQSFGIFMGDQNAVNFAAANTMGLFGGKMVIDPSVPATYLTANAALDVNGGVKIANDAAACAAAKNGTIRYISGGNPPWEFCDGSAWVPFKTPCANDGAGACWLDATRSNSDPQFTSANIADGVNILGVTGTLTGGLSGPSGCANIGDLCADGTVFAGYHPTLHEHLFIPTADQERPGSPGTFTMNWKNATGTNDINPDSTNDGQINHANRGGAIGDFQAFQACEDLSFGGQSDWYLPSRVELYYLWSVRGTIEAGGNITNFQNDFYWSSTENGALNAWHQNFTDGSQSSNTKSTVDIVRCVRR